MNQEKEHRFLDLDITAMAENDCFQATVNKSVGNDREGTHKFCLPFSAADYHNWLAETEGLPGKEGSQAAKANPLRGKSALDLGRMLYQSLIGGDLQKIWQRLLQANKEHRQILRLNLNHSDERLQPFSALPWELMRDDQGHAMAMQNETSLVRLGESIEEHRLLGLPTPVKILIVQAMPNSPGFEAYDRDGLATKLMDHLNNDDIEITVLPGKQSLDKVRDYMNRETVHVLHFTGHGGVYNGKRALAFEDDHGGVDYVDGERLCNYLNHASLAMVCLFSCEANHVAGVQKADPFSGIAQSLTGRNIPAVLATQAPLLIKDLPRFAGYFYKTLCNGEGILAALTEARIRLSASGTTAWANPVLYLRAKHDNLFRKLAHRLYLNTFDNISMEREEAMRDSHIRLLDLGEYFASRDGSDHKKSRIPEDVRDWTKMVAKLERVQVGLSTDRITIIEGRYPLPLAFALGRIFCQTTQHKLIVRQFNLAKDTNEDWPIGSVADDCPLQAEVVDGSGEEDILVCISVSRDIRHSVKEFLTQSKIAVRAELYLEPAQGPGRESLPNTTYAQALAGAMVRKIQESFSKHHGKIHLFLSCPSAFATMLGWHLSSSGSIQTYVFSEGQPAYQEAAFLGSNGQVKN